MTCAGFAGATKNSPKVTTLTARRVTLARNGRWTRKRSMSGGPGRVAVAQCVTRGWPPLAATPESLTSGLDEDGVQAGYAVGGGEERASDLRPDQGVVTGVVDR